MSNGVVAEPLADSPANRDSQPSGVTGSANTAWKARAVGAGGSHQSLRRILRGLTSGMKLTLGDQTIAATGRIGICAGTSIRTTTPPPPVTLTTTYRRMRPAMTTMSTRPVSPSEHSSSLPMRSISCGGPGMTVGRSIRSTTQPTHLDILAVLNGVEAVTLLQTVVLPWIQTRLGTVWMVCMV